MKKNVIIWGTGSGYKKRAYILNQLYNIIAFTDNTENKKELDGISYIKPNEISHMEYDYIIVCVVKYDSTIKYKLINQLKVKPDKIIGINELLHISDYKMDVEGVIFDSISQYKSKNTNHEFDIDENELWLICNDYDKAAGKVLEHYFAQDIWGGRKIFENMPIEHYDIGSRLDGFIAHILTFLPKVYYIDIRPLPNKIRGLEFIQGNAMNLERFDDESIESLSSFHAIEHFGLGRYGDPIDPDGTIKALKEFQRILRPGGKLYLGVPIGPSNKLLFNAHRIFQPNWIIQALPKLSLLDFSVVQNQDAYWEEVDISYLEVISDSLEDYSCGLFEFVKN